MVGGSLRIVFFGTPAFAVPALEHLLASAHPVVAVVTQPDRPRGRGWRSSESPVKMLARVSNLPVLQPQRLTDEEFLRALAAVKADLGVVVAYGRLLPDAVLAMPFCGLINVHASLLPRYRGAAPIQRAIMAGEQQTGVTIMQVVRELDAGPIFGCDVRPIDPDEDGERVARDLAVMGARLLVRVVDELAEGDTRAVPQDQRLATYAPRLTKEEGLIDWSRPANAVHDRVRALHPWPHAFTYLNGARHLVRRTALERGYPLSGGPSQPSAAPGQILEARGDTLRVATGQGGSLLILEIQAEGRRAMTAREFLAGHTLAPGSTFGASWLP